MRSDQLLREVGDLVCTRRPCGKREQHWRGPRHVERHHDLDHAVTSRHAVYVTVSALWRSRRHGVCCCTWLRLLESRTPRLAPRGTADRADGANSRGGRAGEGFERSDMDIARNPWFEWSVCPERYRKPCSGLGFGTRAPVCATNRIGSVSSWTGVSRGMLLRRSLHAPNGERPRAPLFNWMI